MFLIAIVTSSLIGTAHLGNAPVVTVPGTAPVSVVYAQPAPERPSPVKEPPRPQPPGTPEIAKPAKPGPLASGPARPPQSFSCYGYIVNPALDPKYQIFTNPGALQPACYIGGPGAPAEGW